MKLTINCDFEISDDCAALHLAYYLYCHGDIGVYFGESSIEDNITSIVMGSVVNYGVKGIEGTISNSDVVESIRFGECIEEAYFFINNL